MKKQKKYFKINLILFILGVLLIFVLGQIHHYKVNEYNKFLRVPEKLEIVNLGSSHGKYGFKYPQYVKGYNLGVSSQSLYYDFKILKKYSDKIEKKGIVLIPISIFTFAQGENIKYLNEVHSSFLDYKEIHLGDKREYFLKKYFPLLYNGKLLPSIIKYIIKDGIKEKFSARSTIYPKNLTLEEKLIENKYTFESHMGIKNEKFNQPPEIDRKILEEIIKFCKQKEILPILISTPQSYIYNDSIGDKNYKEKIYSQLEVVEESLVEKFIYLDYSHDQRFENNLELFFDDDHLNEQGAEKFTKIVIDDLKEKGFLK